MANDEERHGKQFHKEQAVKALSIPQIFSASYKILENARELIEEAELLLRNNHYPRAFALAHLASEELIKCQLLLPVAIELARDHRVDWKKIHLGLKEHRVKIGGAIVLNFVLDPPSDGVYQASELSQQMSTLQDTNDIKNYSLYASQIGHEYFKPSERIDDQAAIACVSHARGLQQMFQMFHSGLSALTGMTEEGLRRCVATPAFQALLQALGDKTDLSHFPVIDKQQAVVELTASLNEPTLQAMLAQFPPLVEQALQSLNQSHNDDPQTADRISDHNQEDTLKGVTSMTTSEERRDKRFYEATIAALKDIDERAMQLPQEQRYAAAYGILRGYVESLLVNFAEAWSSNQLAEIRIVLDQLAKVTGEDQHLDEATRKRLDQLAQALRESE